MIHFLYDYFLTRKSEKKRSQLYLWLHWQLYKFLKVSLMWYYKHKSLKSLGVNPASNVIVSLTSFPARIDVIHLAIKSMFNQTVRPQKIVLWLGSEKFPKGEIDLPSQLLELKSLGLEIAFCDDIGAHTKYYYAFQKYPENLVVTVDDDVIYPKNLLEVLLNTYKTNPQSVVANRVRTMELDGDVFTPYRTWKINSSDLIKPSKIIFATGVGGVLYKPSFFLKSFFDTTGMKKTHCIGDDIWLKAGQIANNVPVVFTNYYFKQFIEIPESQKENLFSTNVFEADNDRQVKAVFDYFGITEKSFE